jgi:hypothetical protein
MEAQDINTTNDFGFGVNEYKQLQPILPVIISTKQQAYRTAIWLMFFADFLLDEGTKHTYEQIEKAIANS